MGIVTRVGVDPREPALVCSEFSPQDSGQAGLFCRGHPKAAEPSSSLLRLFWEPTSRGRQGHRDGRHGWAGTSPVWAAGLHSSCPAQLRRGASFLPPKPCRNSSPSSHRGHPPAHGLPPTPHSPPRAQRGRAPLPRAHSSHASCPLGPARRDTAGGGAGGQADTPRQ